MAKMISNFSKTILRNMPDTSRKCAFDDIEEIERFMRENCGLYFKTVPELRDYLFGKEKV
jgi:hypothetical protein